MANQKIEVSFIDKSLALRMSNPTTGVVGSWEYHPVCNLVSLTGQAFIGFATRDLTTNQRRQRYPSDNMTKVIVETNGTHQLDIQFDLNDVINQVGWTADVAGMEAAKADINAWIAQCTDPSGGAGGGATEATLLNVLAAADNHKDFEMKLVKDTGAADQIIKEIKTYDQDTGVAVTTYEDASGAVYVPVGPLVYMDPESVLNLVLAELTGVNLSLGSVAYTDAINHNTTAGKNTVMITCETGVESINGVVRSAGVYTFQPTMNDANAVIVVNANNGKIIVDEL